MTPQSSSVPDSVQVNLELLPDWNKDLCAAYERAQRKWGDPWKLALVNPILKSTISSLVENANPVEVDVYKALLSPAEVLPPRKQLTSKDLEGWYAPKRRLHSSRRRHLSILDLGCGPARLRAFVTKLGHEYIGIDSAPTYVHGAIHSINLDAPNVRTDLEQVLGVKPILS